MKRVRKVARRYTRKSFKMLSGPLDGQTLLLSQPGTLIFTLKGQTGYYNEHNIWTVV